MKKFSLFCFCCALVSVTSLIYISCAKEYSFEGGNTGAVSSGTAAYTLQGAGGQCLGSVINGSYYKGTALTADNNIELVARVTASGTYTFSTNSVNGVQFSSSGTFADTGIQTITLTGVGTPSGEGTFSFNTPGSAGCSFSIEFGAAPVVVGVFTLAGAPDNCEDPVINGSYVESEAMKSTNFADLNINVTATGPYTVTTDTIDGIYYYSSGNFTSAGPQTLRLNAGGTPNAPANLTFKPQGATSPCTFNVSVVNQGLLATYVLESGFGNPSPCISVVSGDYVSNTSLSAGNSIQMNVYVQDVGNFTVQSNTVNGMTFSYTGTFTQTGNQKIVLVGSGTPIAQGSFTIIPQIVGPHSLGGEACAIKVDVQ